jgi:lipopolysaccharide export system permease protein
MATAFKGFSLTRLDRYILSQLFGPFVFFVVIFCGILWLNQAVKIIDLVVGNGQSGMVFLEISALLLPRVLQGVIALSGFATAVYVTNRLFGESELVVMMSAGRGPFRLAVPYVFFGVICFLLVSVMAHFLSPLATGKFNQRKFEIQQEFVAQIVKEGEFISPDDTVTLFFGFTGANGELRDVLIRETDEDGIETLYTSLQGQIVQDDTSVQIVLVDGNVQRLDQSTDALGVVQFDSFSYDLSRFGNFGVVRKIGTDDLSTAAILLRAGKEAWASIAPHKITTALNERVLDALTALVAPLLGVAALLVGRFRRTGFLTRIIGAVLLMIAVNATQGALVSLTLKSDVTIWIIYIPIVFAIGISALLLWIGSREGRRPKRKTRPVTA